MLAARALMIRSWIEYGGWRKRKKSRTIASFLTLGSGWFHLPRLGTLGDSRGSLERKRAQWWIQLEMIFNVHMEIVRRPLDI